MKQLFFAIICIFIDISPPTPSDNIDKVQKCAKKIEDVSGS